MFEELLKMKAIKLGSAENAVGSVGLLLYTILFVRFQVVAAVLNNNLNYYDWACHVLVLSHDTNVYQTEERKVNKTQNKMVYKELL